MILSFDDLVLLYTSDRVLTVSKRLAECAQDDGSHPSMIVLLELIERSTDALTPDDSELLSSLISEKQRRKYLLREFSDYVDLVGEVFSSLPPLKKSKKANTKKTKKVSSEDVDSEYSFIDDDIDIDIDVPIRTLKETKENLKLLLDF